MIDGACAAQMKRAWLRELDGRAEGAGDVAFPSARGHALSRDGVDHLLRRAVATAAAACPSLGAKRVSPHVLRHSTAMHLFQAGVDMAVIALWLGHESLETTHVYVEADLATKERALGKFAPMPPGTPARYRPDDKLLAFLGLVEDMPENDLQARLMCSAGAFGDLADDPAASLACNPSLDLSDAEVG